ncbi:MAG TPA: hypothetical protein VEC12_16010, partial [Bacteroidia bacterium]|nr:hypothetical protein [Bacteroidia bacterium]
MQLLKYIPWLLFFVLPLTGNTQNLVPNGSFEQLKPNYTLGSFYRDFDTSIKFWHSPGNYPPFVIKKEPFEPPERKVMDGFGCFYFLPRTGRVAIHMHNHVYLGEPGGRNNWRSYLQTQLTSKLEQGKKYEVKFYVLFSSSSSISMNEIGIFFSNDSVRENRQKAYTDPTYSMFTPPLTPQLEYTGENLKDTSKWVEMKWIYTATGNENWITIGRFNNDTLSKQKMDTLNFKCEIDTNMYKSYLSFVYLLDDVSVVELGPVYGETKACRNDSVLLVALADSFEYWSSSAAGTDTLSLNDSIWVKITSDTSVYLFADSVYQTALKAVDYPVLNLSGQRYKCEGDEI